MRFDGKPVAFFWWGKVMFFGPPEVSYYLFNLYFPYFCRIVPCFRLRLRPATWPTRLRLSAWGYIPTLGTLFLRPSEAEVKI